MDVDHEDESVEVIEMFVDDATGIGLWGEEDDLEDDLPMPDDLRQRIMAWIDEYTATITDPVVRRRWTMDDEVQHDVRGYELSRELQQVLGPSVRIDYKSHTDEGRRLAGDSVGQPIHVRSPGGWESPPGRRAGVNWFPPHGAEPRLEDAPALVTWAFHRPLLHRLAQRWLWTHGGWTVEAAPGYRPDDAEIVQPGSLLRGRAGDRVRLMNDYGVRFPLWSAWGAIEDEERLRSLGIGEGLQAELETWQQSWDERPLGSWDNRRHRAEGRRLLKRLRASAPVGIEFVIPHKSLHDVLHGIVRPIRSLRARRHRPDDWPHG
jgi:hypothetical protein